MFAMMAYFGGLLLTHRTARREVHERERLVICARITEWQCCRTGETTMDEPDRWALEADGKALVRSFKFKDFSEAFAFLTRVAMHAEKVDHHPEFTSVWNRVDFRLTSHDAGGVTNRDRELAEAINALADR